MPFLNGGVSGHRWLRYKESGETLAVPPPSQWLSNGGYLANVWRSSGCHKVGGGAWAWRALLASSRGRGQRCCSTPTGLRAQGSILIEELSSRAVICSQPHSGTSPKAPSELRGSPTDLSYTRFRKVPNPSLIGQDSLPVEGSQRGGDLAGDHEQMLLCPPTTPTPAQEKSQAWAIFGQTRKRKAEPQGNPLHPTCPAAKVGVISSCTEVHAGNRRQDLAPGGWEEKQAGQAGGWAVTRPSLVLNQGLHLVHRPGPASGPVLCQPRPSLQERKAEPHEPSLCLSLGPHFQQRP